MRITGVGRRTRIAVGGVAALLVAWLAGMTVLLVLPRTDRPTHVDAVLVLGPPSRARLDAGLALVRSGAATNLVVSVPGGLPSGTRRRAEAICADPPAGVSVVCFRPDPSTTMGEGQELARLAVARSWSSVAVVTSRYHVSRARFIIGHCTDDVALHLVAAPERISPTYWAYQYLYQTAGFAKALLQWRC